MSKDQEKDRADQERRGGNPSSDKTRTQERRRNRDKEENEGENAGDEATEKEKENHDTILGKIND